MKLHNVRDLRGLGGVRESIGVGVPALDSRTPSSTRPTTIEVPGDGELDLEGRWVIDGLWDHHVHFNQWILASRWIDMAPATSAAHAAQIVREAIDAGRHEPGTVLMGAGFRDALWPDAPSLDLLEFGDIPVGLISGDVHTVWVNRATLRLLGRPESDWWLREQPAYDINGELSQVPADRLDRWALDAVAAAAARGLVGMVDLEMEDAPGSWARRFGAGFADLRVRASVYPHTPALPDFAHPLFEIGPFKLFTDGSLNTRTAWCEHPYPGTSDSGLPSYAPGELLAAARGAVERRLIPTIHAIGDRAVTEALDVFEALGSGGSIEHAQLVSDADLPRFAKLGVVASVQPEHALDDRDVADRYWAGRTDRAFAYRSLLDAGATLAFGSDAPVAPLDPWITISAAVTRTRDGREPWHPEQAVTPAEALAASTYNTPADLVILDADPLEPGNLREMPVHATMVAGKWTHGPHA